MSASDFSESLVTDRDGGLLAWNLLTGVLALIGTAGSLWLSLGMDLKACPLCLYQRTFLMGVVGVLLVGMLTDARRSALLPLLALPAALGGLGVALFHEYLEASGKLECPAGLFGLGTAPQQSLAVFLVLTGCLSAALLSGRRSPETRIPALIAAVVFGLLFAWGAIKTAPPMPAAPAESYRQPLEMCRPPYHQSPEGLP